MSDGPHAIANPIWRYALIGFGWLCVAAGVVGIFLPLLPTTPFLLLALWAFARSSDKLHAWLREHPRLGHYVIDWEEAGVIPPRGKILSLTMMTASVLWLWLGTDISRWIVATVAVTLICVGFYIVTRPNRREDVV